MWWKRLLQCDSEIVSDSGSGSRRRSRSTSSKLQVIYDVTAGAWGKKF